MVCRGFWISEHFLMSNFFVLLRTHAIVPKSLELGPAPVNPAGRASKEKEDETRV
jgi:hypothetical protein